MVDDISNLQRFEQTLRTAKQRQNQRLPTADLAVWDPPSYGESLGGRLQKL